MVVFCQAANQNNQCGNSENADNSNCPAVVLEEPPVCGVYMAPSTVSSESNLGIYTALDLKRGQVVNFPEIAIPILFREWDLHPLEDPDGMLWDRYLWEGDVMNIETKNASNVEQCGSVFVPGVGCTVNSMLHMANIHSTHGSTYDTMGLHRSKHAGVGAFSPNHGATTTASMDIEAGSELFAAYGEGWIPDIPKVVVAMDNVLDEADEFLLEYTKWMDQHVDIPEPLKEGLWNFTTQHFPLDSKVLNALPRLSWSRVMAAFSETNEDENSVVRHFIRKDGKRSKEWLVENGKCQDHLRPGRSTIYQAGMGAFANRFLPKGTVVGYAPLVHIGKNAIELLKIQYNNTQEGDYQKQDLILNYSFGHANSTLILTPYGAMVNYINHDKNRANVKVTWPTKELVAHKPDWLNKSVDFFANTQHKIGLSFDYVALRDIQEGEEIFMDYGVEWEEAWNDHVKNYKPGSPDYVHSTDWKANNGRVLRTPLELEKDPYPPNLHTMCVESYNVGPDGRLTWLASNSVLRVPCRVLERQQGGRYTVEMQKMDNNNSITVYNVLSPSGIDLVDKVRSSDWHLKSAFRHEIMIPDDIFPDSWRNVLEYKII